MTPTDKTEIGFTELTSGVCRSLPAGHEMCIYLNNTNSWAELRSATGLTFAPDGSESLEKQVVHLLSVANGWFK